MSRRPQATKDDGLPRSLEKPWIAALIAMVALGNFVSVGLSLPKRSRRIDFSLYYVPAVALREGVNPYTNAIVPVAAKLGMDLGDAKQGAGPPPAETPTLLLFFEPLSLLAPAAAYWTWQSLNLVALGLALAVLLASGGVSAPMSVSLGALASLDPVVAINFEYAQTQILLLLILVLVWRDLRDERDARAGILLAVASLLRAFPLVLAGYLVVRGRWRALRWMAIGAAVGAILTLLIVGESTVMSFPAAMRVNATHAWHPLGNVSISAFWLRLFGYVTTTKPGPALTLLFRTLTVLIKLTLLGIAIWVTLPHRLADDTDGRGFSLWIVLMILLSPIAWLHYLVLLILPFGLAIVSEAHRRDRRVSPLIVASYLLTSYLVIVPIVLIDHGVRMLPAGLSRQLTTWALLPAIFVMSEHNFLALCAAWLAMYLWAASPAAAAGTATSAS